MKSTGNLTNSFYSRDWDDISARQTALREKLGLIKPRDSQGSNLRMDRGSIPSIDGDNGVERHTQERSFKSRSLYTDDAEESLQFFKKNLMPKSESRQESPTKFVNNEQSNFRSTPKTIERINENPRNYRYDTPINRAAPDVRRNSSGTGRPAPLSVKESFLDDPSLGDPYPVSEHRETLDRNSNNEFRNNLNTTKPKNLETTTNSANHDSSDHYVANSRSPTEPFSRRPLYNSLLRAHDSIRLKVNRPKVRSKSAEKVDDTEIVDDTVVYGESREETAPNERAIDVRNSLRKSKKKKDKKNEVEEDKIPIRNFTDIRIVKVLRTETERSLGVTVRVEDGNIVVARILAGSLADKQGALQVGDIILSVNKSEVYTPEQVQEELKRSINDDIVLLKIVPSFREELPTLCVYLRALFSYDANEDTILPCKELGVSFNQGDILEVVNQEDPNWWQARRVDSESLQTGLIPSQMLEERRRAFVLPDYDLATRTSICGTKVTRKSKKKEFYNIGQNNDFDKAELQLYEEVCRTPAFERRTLVLIGANGVGKQALKARLISTDSERFGSPLAHTSRLPREGEEDGVHYHFVTREKMEEDIIDGRYLEYGEYDGALYGTKLDSVREIIGSGKICVLDCSPTCLKILKTADYLPFVAFIAAPTLDQLRYLQDWGRGGNKNYSTFDRALSRQSRRARTIQEFAFDFFEDEDLQLTVEESARLFRIYENYFDIVLVNNHFEKTFEQLREAIDALSMAPQWIPISWIYGT